jgi:putative acetyltransferase
MPIQVEHIATPTDDARTLIGELDAELNAAYLAEQRHGLNMDRIFQPNVRFFIARLDGQPVGCGGIALTDGVAELKRMYVRPSARGRGVARAILALLESEALAHGFTRVMLETGNAQLAAIRFYEAAGFTRCAAFGDYAAMPPATIERSIFFEKMTRRV